MFSEIIYREALIFVVLFGGIWLLSLMFNRAFSNPRTSIDRIAGSMQGLSGKAIAQSMHQSREILIEDRPAVTGETGARRPEVVGRTLESFEDRASL